MGLRILELYCGIGGCAEAVKGHPEARVVLAIDQSPAALAVHRLNFPGIPAREANLEDITADALAAAGADLWWLSPPCQPYTVKGARRDLDDPRALSLRKVLGALEELARRGRPGAPGGPPRSLALENVEGFASSRARALLVSALAGSGYVVQERILCPTELGVPSRRPRYYLLASADALPPVPPTAHHARKLAEFLEPASSPELLDQLLLPLEQQARFAPGLRVLNAGDADDPAAYTTCFTSGYATTLMRSGSFLRAGARIRRFSPEEIARLLGFGRDFRFPEELSLKRRWQLVGNSLSVFAVREVLRPILGRKVARG